MLVKWYIVNAVMLLLLTTRGSAVRSAKAPDPSREKDNEEKLTKELESAVKNVALIEKLEKENNSTRESRGLLKKLSFLAGVKVGGILQSSGTLAASNSIRLFGKVLNTALSVSYGSADELEPLPEIHKPLVNNGIDIRPIVEEEEPPKVEAGSDSGADVVDNKVRDALESDVEPTLSTLQAIRQNFLKNHNAHVGRVNHKFLRDGSMARYV